MRPLHTIAGHVLTQIIQRQPPSSARTTFAWQLVVGPALARVTSVELETATLRVRAADPRWLTEIDRARATILPRLQALLGADAVTKINVRM